MLRLNDDDPVKWMEMSTNIHSTRERDEYKYKQIRDHIEWVIN